MGWEGRVVCLFFRAFLCATKRLKSHDPGVPSLIVPKWYSAPNIGVTKSQEQEEETRDRISGCMFLDLSSQFKCKHFLSSSYWTSEPYHELDSQALNPPQT